MKTIILLIALFFFSFSFSQDYKIVYQQVFSETWKDQKTLFEFKEDSNILEMTNLESGFKITFIKLTDFNEFETEGGLILHQAIYYDELTEAKVGIQLFEEEKYGIRLVYVGGDSFQYSDILSKE